MKELKKFVSNEYDSLSEVATVYGFENGSELLLSDSVISRDQTIEGLMCGVGMDQDELKKKLYSGVDTLGYSYWSLFYLKKHDQYILINNFH